MTRHKLFIASLFLIVCSPLLFGMQKHESKTEYIDVLVQENGKLVWKIAVKTGRYYPNPRLTLDIQYPQPRLNSISPENAFHLKFPMKTDCLLNVLFDYLIDPQEYIQARVKVFNAFLLHGDIKKDARFFAQLIHQEFQLPFIHIHGYQLLDNFRSEGAKKVERALTMRSPNGRRPLLLFIEDFDPIAAIPSYETDDNTEYEWRMSKSTFRFHFDKLKKDPSIILLVSTKNKYRLDAGIIDRFASSCIEITPMNLQERETLLTTACEKLVIEDKQNTIKKLAKISEGLSRKTLTKIIGSAHKLLPEPNNETYSREILMSSELEKVINDTRDKQGISWSGLFKKLVKQ